MADIPAAAKFSEVGTYDIATRFLRDHDLEWAWGGIWRCLLRKTKVRGAIRWLGNDRWQAGVWGA